MTTTTPKKATWHVLNQAEGGRVWIEPKKGEPFGLPIDEVIRACRSQEKIPEFVQQVSDLKDHLGGWMSGLASEISRAYLALEPDGAVFVVVRKDKRFNPDFEDSLSSLDLGIADDPAYNLVKLRTLALPYSSDMTASSFLNTSRCLMWSIEEDDQTPR